MVRHAYVGTKPCGCTVAAVVDDPAYRKDTARSVAEFIADGLNVERVSLESARVTLTTCRCTPVSEQAGLPI
jgi:hypothetical protein